MDTKELVKTDNIYLLSFIRPGGQGNRPWPPSSSAVSIYSASRWQHVGGEYHL